MTPDQLAAFVGAKTGAEIVAYENDEDDLLSLCFGGIRLDHPALRKDVGLLHAGLWLLG